MTKKKKTPIKQKKSKKEEPVTLISRFFAKKPYIEFIAALLSIPLFISILILNFNSIRNIAGGKVTPTPNANAVSGDGGGFLSAPLGSKKSITPGTSQAPCEKGLGSISITSPSEGETVSNNPVEIDISYDDSQHCGAVWSYRVNGGNWSDYDDRSVALYNLPRGSVQFELRVKSIVGSDQTSLTRNFTYNGQSGAIVPTVASNSAQ